jgi:hypothetical protein
MVVGLSYSTNVLTRLPLDDKIRERLLELRFSPEFVDLFYETFWGYGEPTFWQMAERHAKSERATDKIFDEYYPRLRAFEAECRRKTPVPDIATFSERERAQFEIILKLTAELKENWGSLSEPRPRRATSFRTTRVGLAAAHQLLDGNRVVILTSEEGWIDMPQLDLLSGSFWCSHYKVDLLEGLAGIWDETERQDIQTSYPIPDGSTYWIADQWFASSQIQDVWEWNGSVARYLGTGSVASMLYG